MIPRRVWTLLVTLGVVVLDRASKHWIETAVSDWQTIPVIPGLFQIVHTRNTGIAFGLFAGESGEDSSPLLLGLTCTVMLFIAWLLWNASRPNSAAHWTLKSALALVLGGAIGNFYDRVVFGSVTDFLDFYWGRHHFPVFNVADSAITVGACLLLLNLWYASRESASTKVEAPPVRE